jgi:hypothetical protein
MIVGVSHGHAVLASRSSFFFLLLLSSSRTVERARGDNVVGVSGGRGLASLPCLRRANGATGASQFPLLLAADASFAGKLQVGGGDINGSRYRLWN